MLWIIDGLIYGFFTALYTLVNQHYKFNGYLLGIWRGFGISFFFLPFLFFLPVPDDAYYLAAGDWLRVGIYCFLFGAVSGGDAGCGSVFRVVCGSLLCGRHSF